MRVLLILFLLLPRLAWGLCALAPYEDRLPPDTRAKLEADTRAQPFAQGLLWQATKDDTQLVIAGTIHLPHPRSSDLAARMRPHVQNADLLLVEATRADLRAAERAFLTEPDFALMTDTTLPELLDEPTWQRLIPALSKRGMPAVLGSRLEPWAVTMILANAPCLTLAMTKGGLDETLMAEAEAANVPIQAIENWRDTLTRLRQPTRAQDITALRLTIDADADADALAATTLKAYADGLTGRALTMARHAASAHSADARAMTDEMIKSLLDARNADWLPPIETAARNNHRIAIAVGAAHLPGDHGLLNLLATSGWTVTPLP